MSARPLSDAATSKAAAGGRPRISHDLRRAARGLRAAISARIEKVPQPSFRHIEMEAPSSAFDFQTHLIFALENVPPSINLHTGSGFPLFQLTEDQAASLDTVFTRLSSDRDAWSSPGFHVGRESPARAIYFEVLFPHFTESLVFRVKMKYRRMTAAFRQEPVLLYNLAVYTVRNDIRHNTATAFDESRRVTQNPILILNLSWKNTQLTYEAPEGRQTYAQIAFSSEGPSSSNILLTRTHFIIDAELQSIVATWYACTMRSLKRHAPEGLGDPMPGLEADPSVPAPVRGPLMSTEVIRTVITHSPGQENCPSLIILPDSDSSERLTAAMRAWADQPYSTHARIEIVFVITLTDRFHNPISEQNLFIRLNIGNEVCDWAVSTADEAEISRENVLGVEYPNTIHPLGRGQLRCMLGFVELRRYLWKVIGVPLGFGSLVDSIPAFMLDEENFWLRDTTHALYESINKFYGDVVAEYNANVVTDVEDMSGEESDDSDVTVVSDTFLAQGLAALKI